MRRVAGRLVRRVADRLYLLAARLDPPAVTDDVTPHAVLSLAAARRMVAEHKAQQVLHAALHRYSPAQPVAEA